MHSVRTKSGDSKTYDSEPSDLAFSLGNIVTPQPSEASSLAGFLNKSTGLVYSSRPTWKHHRQQSDRPPSADRASDGERPTRIIFVGWRPAVRFCYQSLIQQALECAVKRRCPHANLSIGPFEHFLPNSVSALFFVGKREQHVKPIRFVSVVFWPSVRVGHVG